MLYSLKAVIEFGRQLKVQIEEKDKLSDFILVMKYFVKRSTAATHFQQFVKSKLKKSYACQLTKRKHNS